ncbi:MAG: hypothetical protein JRF02_01080 [Deltaproteobacteria bacterium]|nr:hypothetical protein [Deltaproteobacteria bacterium]
MKCKETEECPVRQKPDIPCWETAKEIKDHRRIFNICKDCVVYMLKGSNPGLSEAEVGEILRARNICVLA